MIKWIDAIDQAESKYSDLGPQPTAKIGWYAYKNGKVLGVSEISASDAKCRFNTSIVEQVVLNSKEIDAWRKRETMVEADAMDIWMKSLREEYSYISDHVFDVCYQHAYAEGHS